MKARVLSRFKDKHTGEVYRPGDVFECTAERLAEIRAVGAFAEEMLNEAEAAQEEAVNSVRARLEGMTAVQLRAYADKQYKLTFGENMKKAEMIDALLEREKG